MKLGLPIQWRIGGALLGGGGLTSLVGSIVFQFGPTALGTVLTFAAILFEGAGVLTISFGFGSRILATWARRLLFVTGILILLEFLSSVALLFAPAGASLLVTVLFIATVAALLISAIEIARSPAVPRRVRFALMPAALYGVIDYFLLESGDGGQWWTLGILGALYAVAGVLFFVAGRRSPVDSPVESHPA